MDEAKTFPRTMVGGVSLPRMICGTNWLLGYSHTGGVADKMIRDYHHCAERMASVIETYLDEGCDALMAPYSTQPMLQEAVRLAEEHKNHKVIIIDTPGMNVDDTPSMRPAARPRQPSGTPAKSAQPSASSTTPPPNSSSTRTSGKSHDSPTTSP